MRKILLATAFVAFSLSAFSAIADETCKTPQQVGDAIVKDVPDATGVRMSDADVKTLKPYMGLDGAMPGDIDFNQIILFSAPSRHKGGHDEVDLLVAFKDGCYVGKAVSPFSVLVEILQGRPA